MTFKKNALEYTIRTESDIARLVYLRDFGLNKILADPDISDEDFNESDVAEFVSLINNRILELGGTI